MYEYYLLKCILLDHQLHQAELTNLFQDGFTELRESDYPPYLRSVIFLIFVPDFVFSLYR